MGALDTVGWVAQVIVNKRTGHIVDGHARVELALAREEETVPVVYVDLSPEEEAVVLASLDPLSAMATSDPEKLDALLRTITVSDDALRAMFAEMKTPTFEPVNSDEKSTAKSDLITCPACGHEFDPSRTAQEQDEQEEETV